MTGILKSNWVRLWFVIGVGAASGFGCGGPEDPGNSADVTEEKAHATNPVDCFNSHVPRTAKLLAYKGYADPILRPWTWGLYQNLVTPYQLWDFTISNVDVPACFPIYGFSVAPAKFKYTQAK